MIVLLALGVVTTVLVSLQATSFRQAAAGRETLARLRASWAARAGIESVIARLENGLEAGHGGSAFTYTDAMSSAASGEVEGASWSIAHTIGNAYSSEAREGVEDPHAKVNVNRMPREDLLQLDGMTEDMADSILDWIDGDDAPNSLGAEEGYYSQLPSPYRPRNGPIPSLDELELVAGVTPDLVRGEDWNLSGRLEANEDDGDLSWPPDSADGVLNAGWSALLTATSAEPELGASGQARLDLKTAAPDELIARVSTLDPTQALVVLDYAARGNTRMEELISTSLQTIAQQSSGLPATVRNLGDDQLRALFDECTFSDVGAEAEPGRVNINTVSRETLDYILAIPAGVADALILARDAQAQGFTNIMDLLEVPSMSRGRLAALSESIGVEAGAYTISARGVDRATGTEALLVCVVRAGSVPVTLMEVRAP